MLDTSLRRALAPTLDSGARRLDRAGIGPGGLTAFGLALGIGCSVAAALAAWMPALALWLANRSVDGLDGPLARIRGATDLGGILDFLADFVVYAGFPIGVAIALPDSRLAACVLLGTYLLNNVALLSFASVLERRRVPATDERSLRLTSGLVEGTETIVCYSLVCLLPDHAATIFWVFAAAVLATAAQRVVVAFGTLGEPDVSHRDPESRPRSPD